MTIGIVFALQADALTAQAQVSAALGWPSCARMHGTVIGSVPPCACTTGLPGGVAPACPYATRAQTDVVVDALSRPCLVVDAVMQASPAVLAAMPAVATAVVIALPAPVALGDAVADALI